MKVILDVESIHGNLTGIGRYSLELGSRLPSVVADQVKYWNGSSFQDHLVCDQCGAVNESFFRRLCSRLVFNRYFVGLGRRLPRPAKRFIKSFLQLSKAKNPEDLLEDYASYIFHGPNFFLPNFSGKKVVTVHDMSVFRFPEYHPADRVRFMSEQVPKALKEADAVIAISDFTKSELLEFFPSVKGKVHVVHNGANKPNSIGFSKSDAQVINDLGLVRGEFFLCVSTVEPRKNLSTLLSAYLALPDIVRRRFPLVLVGGNGWKSDLLMEKIRSSSGSNVRYLGFAEQEALEALYKSAKAFVFPSLYEGFGLPAIEAMSYGLPVVCAKATAVSEVCGGNALEFDGSIPEELTELLARLAEDEGLAERLSIASLRQSELYSWERCSNETAAVYRSLIR